MAQIPTVPGSFQVHTPDAGVKIDFNALDAPNRALARQGQALGEVGQQMGDFALKMQSAVNYGIASDADRKMREASANFKQSRAGRTDEDQWQTQWKEVSDRTWQEIQASSRIGPALSRQLTQNYKDWTSTNSIEVGMMANKQSINRAVDRVGLAADEAAKDGDEAGINAAFDGAIHNHLLLPEQAQKLRETYLTKIDEYAARNYIMNNPAQAADFIGEKDKRGKFTNLLRLDPDQRQTLLNTARVAFGKYQTDNYSDLIESLQNGEVKTSADLQSLVEQKVISPRQRKSYETAYRHGNYNTSPGDIGSLYTEISNYSRESDPQFTKYGDLMARVATSGFPTSVQQDMNALIGQKMDPKSVLNTPVSKDLFEAIDQRFRLGLYGKYETKIMDSLGNYSTIVNDKIYESAMSIKRKVEDAARKYMHDNPNASAEEANNAMYHIQSQYLDNSVEKTVKASVVPGAAVDINRQALDWARANPKDPRAAKVLEKLGIKN